MTQGLWTSSSKIQFQSLSVWLISHPRKLTAITSGATEGRENNMMLSFARSPWAANSNFIQTPWFVKSVIVSQMLCSSRRQTTERTQSGSPHCQSFGPAVWIHKEAPGNGFLMGSWQDRWADRKYVKYLLFWLRLELWPYLKFRA